MDPILRRAGLSPRPSPFRFLRAAWALLLVFGVAAPAAGLASYADAASDEPGSSTGAATESLGVPDYFFQNDAGLGFGGTSTDVFSPGEATVLGFPFPLRDVAAQDDLIVSAYVGGLGATDSALVQVEVSSDGLLFQNVASFDTATGRTTYVHSQERDFSSVKHFYVDFAGNDFVTHVRITNLAGTTEGLRLDAVEGLHPAVGSDHGVEVRLGMARNAQSERFRLRIKNIGAAGGPAIRAIHIENPRPPFPWQQRRNWIEDTIRSLFGLDGEFMCTVNCIFDNDPGAGFSHHEWSVDGLSVAPGGVGLEPGHEANHIRWENFDIDQQGAMLANFQFRILWTDGYVHFFDMNNDVATLGVQGMQFQKYLYFSATPNVQDPLPTDYWEFVLAAPECSDGLDNDGDGLTDHPSDPGCDSASDPGEMSPLSPCDDGLDNDGDYLADFPADPGCGSLSAAIESPQCQDGINNDGDGLIDFDGGQSIHGPCTPGPGGCPTDVSDPDDDGIADPDPACLVASRNNERRRKCGLGAELGLLAPVLERMARRRRRSRRRDGSG